MSRARCKARCRRWLGDCSRAATPPFLPVWAAATPPFPPDLVLAIGRPPRGSRAVLEDDYVYLITDLPWAAQRRLRSFRRGLWLILGHVLHQQGRLAHGEQEDEHRAARKLEEAPDGEALSAPDGFIQRRQ